MTPRSTTFNAHKLQSMVAGRPHEGLPPAGETGLRRPGRGPVRHWQFQPEVKTVITHACPPRPRLHPKGHTRAMRE